MGTTPSPRPSRPRHDPGRDRPARLAGIRRRTLLILSLGQILGGIAFGATISLGAVLAGEVSGRDDLTGLATAAVAGAALLTESSAPSLRTQRQGR